MTMVTREWQAATTPASEAGARVCVLRSAPVIDRRNLPWKAMFPVFGLGIGGMAGSGEQFLPAISARDWVGAAVHLATHDSVSGPVNLSCPQAPRHREFVKGLGSLLHRPTVLRVPSAVVRVAAGRMAPEVLGSTRPVPEVLLASGFTFRDPDVISILREGLSPSR
jgi:NAD dependent epimerase/dehydratase family enzyme